MAAPSVDVIVLDTVRGVVAEVNPTCHTPVRLDSKLDRELGLDSLVRAELLVRVEAALDVRLSEGLLGTAETPRDFADAVRAARPIQEAPPTFRTIERGASVALPDDVRTVTDALVWHADRHPDRVHVHLLGDDPAASPNPLTYAVLRDRGLAIAGGLAHAGVRPGDTVALVLPTSVEYFATFVGILFAGAVPVPLYPPTRLAQIDDYLGRQVGILDNAGTVLLITSLDAERVARVLSARVGSLRQVTTVGALERAARIDVRPPVRADDVALLQYTSGSTGAPKGVVLTHADLLANIRAMARAVRADPSDVFVSWLPLYHDMGLIGAWLGSLCIGFPLVVMSPLSFLVHPQRWLRAISEFRATLSASPNFGFDLCTRKVPDDDLQGFDLSSMRMLFNGAEPVSADSLDRFRARFGPCGLAAGALAPVYGLAEAAVGLAFPPPGRLPIIDRIQREALARSATAVPAGADEADILRVVACGQPLPGYEIRIVDRAGQPLADRQEGRVEFRGPSATQGYFRNPEATTQLFDGDWLDTGDLGYLAGGDIYLTGRVKDIIIRAGRNLHPEDLEVAVGAIPGVRPGCVAVFASVDPEAGTERLVVAVETSLQDAVGREALRRAVVATTVDVLGTPPDDVAVLEPRTILKTSSGKIRRAACRERYDRGDLTAPPHHRRAQLARLAIESGLARVRGIRRTGVGIGYALYAWAVAGVLALPTAAALFVVPRTRWRFAIVRRYLRVLAHVAGVQLTVVGREHLGAVAGSVVVANHPSWIDGAVLACVLPGSPVFVVGAELGQQAWSGPLLRRIGVKFVQRATHEQGAVDTRGLITAVRAGSTLVVFPEGQLSRVPGVRAFRLGAFLAAAEARVPVVTITIRGTRSLLAPGHRLPRRHSIAVDIGEPITTDEPGWAGAVALQRAARANILANCDEPDIA